MIADVQKLSARYVLSGLLIILLPHLGKAQEYGPFPLIPKEKLLLDLELLYQALNEYHSGMYWYTPKDSVDQAFVAAREALDRDMNVLEFHKLMAPLVALTREDHTDIYLPRAVKDSIRVHGAFLPLTVVFLGTELYCVRNGSSDQHPLEGKRIKSINGKTPTEIVADIGSLFASDGYIKTVKYSDLEGFSFARYYYYYYGIPPTFQIQLEGELEPITVLPLPLPVINENLKKRYPNKQQTAERESLEFRMINDSTAYLGIHSFSDAQIKENTENPKLSAFLHTSFEHMEQADAKVLIVDVSENGGGNEGNEGKLYAYLGDNYQKYTRVRAKTQRAILDNGVDKPIRLRTFGWYERTFHNQKMPDGSYERKPRAGNGLMAFKKKPSHAFSGRVYVIISPETYSGGSEFASMAYSQRIGTFIGQETGGGYYGNTSGYNQEVTLPHSGIQVDVPALQFVMNVEGLPRGSGIVPHHTVIPTFSDYQNRKNAALRFILEREAAGKPIMN